MKHTSPDKMLEWGIAGICSVALHVFIIVLLVWSGRPSREAAADADVATASVMPAPGTSEVVPDTPRDVASPPPVSSRDSQPLGNALETRNFDRPATSRTGATRPARTTKPNAAATSAPAAGEGAPKTRSYRVKAGDNLTRLARECGSTPAELAKLNGVDEKKLADLKVGQTIKLKVND